MAKRLQPDQFAPPRDEDISPLEVQLDPENPRLTIEEHGKTQPDLLLTMVSRFKVAELGGSIAASGYDTFDPLVGYRDNGKIYVREGNRRIAALKLLLKPNLLPEQRSVWNSLRESMTAAALASIQKVTIRVYESAEHPAVIAYIGFRHVTSVLKWPALEKAGYIAGLVEKQGWSYQTIAKRIGTKPGQVERHYVAYKMCKQADGEKVAGAPNMRHSFGVLLRALQAPGCSDFIGVSYPDDPAKSKTPIPQSHIGEFRNFVDWTFGTSDTLPVVHDSRQLTQWGRILRSKEAVRYLRTASEPRFERAWLKSGGELETIVESVLAAADRLEEAVPLIDIHSQDAELQGAVSRCARFMRQILQRLPEIGKQNKLEAK